MASDTHNKAVVKTPAAGTPLAVLKSCSSILPLVMGLACGRSGLIVASYGSYTHTDQGIFTDGGMLIALAVLAVAWLCISLKNLHFSKRQAKLFSYFCFAFEAAILFILAALEYAGVQNDDLKLALCAGSALFGSLSIFFWLRKARGSTTVIAAIFAFIALPISELMIYACALMPNTAAYASGCLLALIQYPCERLSRTKSRLFQASSETDKSDSFGFAKSFVSNARFLTVTALGIGLLSMVIGLLRGYPGGGSIGFEPDTRIAYMVLTIVLSLIIVFSVCKGKKQTMTVSIWIIMQTLASVALVCYVAFSDSLDIGAVFTTTLNAMMVGFTWYIVVAFMSYGYKAPYYYAFAGWLVWLGGRAIARIVLIEVYPLSDNSALMAIIVAFLLLLSTQAIFVQFIYVNKQESDTESKKDSLEQSALYKLMGLADSESLSEMRQTTMQHNAQELGKQFLLSTREIEVLTLYALGYTQKRVAEELYISQGTAHAHIKRIYSKTGLHSRQEILDYMKQFTT